MVMQRLSANVWCPGDPGKEGAILRKKHTITNRNDSDRWASVGERFSPLSVLVSYRSDYIRGTDWVRSQYAISGLKCIIFNANNATDIRGPTDATRV